MAQVQFVMALAVFEYFVFGLFVGGARGRFKIEAPATTGHPEFERINRVHMNTLEQLMVLLPSMWLFATWIDARWAAILGLVYIVGRIVYFIGYRKAAEKRSWGFAISALPVMILLAGALWGAGRAALG